MIIQGVAGSGNTSIALHRVAYMLYRNKNTLFVNNIVIISPNEVFADYISNVLPELGEEPIKELSFEKITEEEMEGDLKYDLQIEEPYSIDKKLQERIRFKSSFDFPKQIIEYLKHVNETYFVANNIVIDDFKVAKKFINTRYEAYSNVPVKIRLEEMALEISEKVRSEKIRSDKQTFKTEIYRQLLCFELYRTYVLISA